MTQTKRGSNPSQNRSISTTRAEVERMITELKERVLQSPDKAAKILASWVNNGKKNSNKNKKAA